MKTGSDEMALVMARVLSDFTQVEKRTKNDVANGVLTPEQGALQFKQYGDDMAKVLTTIAEEVFELPSSGWGLGSGSCGSGDQSAIGRRCHVILHALNKGGVV